MPPPRIDATRNGSDVRCAAGALICRTSEICRLSRFCRLLLRHPAYFFFAMLALYEKSAALSMLYYVFAMLRRDDMMRVRAITVHCQTRAGRQAFAFSMRALAARATDSCPPVAAVCTYAATATPVRVR